MIGRHHFSMSHEAPVTHDDQLAMRIDGNLRDDDIFLGKKSGREDTYTTSINRCMLTLPRECFVTSIEFTLWFYESERNYRMTFLVSIDGENWKLLCEDKPMKGSQTLLVNDDFKYIKIIGVCVNPKSNPGGILSAIHFIYFELK